MGHWRYHFFPCRLHYFWQISIIPQMLIFQADIDNSSDINNSVRYQYFGRINQMSIFQAGINIFWLTLMFQQISKVQTDINIFLADMKICDSCLSICCSLTDLYIMVYRIVWFVYNFTDVFVYCYLVLLLLAYFCCK